jgi:hypothetical protein
MAQQTAVEWLADEISYNLFMWPNDTDWMSGLLEKAKQMEKEQIINAHNHGFTEGTCFGATTFYKYMTGEQYYNETYGK